MKKNQTINKSIVLMFVIAAITCFASASWATTYYVSNTGSDSNNGTATTTSFKSIQKSLNSVHAGDTIYVVAGTYNEALTLVTSGTSTARITLSSYNGGTVNINSGNSRAIVCTTSAVIGYYTIHGLNFTSNYVGNYAGSYDYSLDMGITTQWWGYGAPYDGNTGTGNGSNGFIIEYCNILGSIGFDGSYNTVQNCTLNGNGQFTNGIKDITITSHHNVFQNNTIHDYHNRGVWCMSNTHDDQVLNNTIYITNFDANAQVNGVGVDFDGAWIAESRNVMRGNTIWNMNYGMQFENGLNSICEANTIYNCNNNYSSVSYGTSGGAIKEYRTTNTGNIFKNNISYNGYKSGIIINQSPGTYIYFNVIDTTASYFAGVILADGGVGFPSNNCTAENNIFTNNALAFVAQNASGTVETNNIFYGNTSNGTVGNNAIQKDPLYINKTNHNYNIQSGSPAIDTGGAVTSVTTDFQGKPRPQGAGYDIGAYEFQTGTTTAALSAPSNLTVQ